MQDLNSWMSDMNKNEKTATQAAAQKAVSALYCSKNILELILDRKMCHSRRSVTA